jgi:hypothetical protein
VNSVTYLPEPRTEISGVGVAQKIVDMPMKDRCACRLLHGDTPVDMEFDSGQMVARLCAALGADTSARFSFP